MNKSPKTAFSLLIPAVIFVAAGAAIFAFQNFSNKRVLSGFAGYVYSKPIFGQNRFEGILIGPSSTGWAWRKEVSKVSITPDTTVEEFDARNGGAILGKDKLPISCKASLVYRLDPSRVKEFMEDYGGIAQSSGRNDDEVADEIMLFAYKNFIQQPFRTAVRAELSQYNALDASGSLQKISDNVYTQLSKRLDGTPFIVDSVAVGETNPPQAIIESVVRKVQTTQENERKETELQIARKDIAIQRARGEAEGAMKMEIARQEANANLARGEAEAKVIVMRGKAQAEAALEAARAEAEGLALKEKAMGPNMLRAKAFENMLNNAKVYLPSGKDAEGNMSVLGILNLDKEPAKETHLFPAPPERRQHHEAAGPEGEKQSSSSSPANSYLSMNSPHIFINTQAVYSFTGAMAKSIKGPEGRFRMIHPPAHMAPSNPA